MQLLIVDQDRHFRRTMAAQLERRSGLSWGVGSAGFAEALSALSLQRVDVTLLDVASSEYDGLELIRAMRLARPAMGILVATDRRERSVVVRALRNGANAYVGKMLEAHALAQAVQRVAAGERFVCPRIAGAQALHTLLEEWPRTRASDPRVRANGLASRV